MLCLFHFLVHQPDTHRDGGASCFARLQTNGKVWQMCRNNWIVPEVPMGYFKFSFRYPQWKGAHGNPRRRRFFRCNQSKRSPCHCRESIQHQEFCNTSDVTGMFAALPISFLLSGFIFRFFSFYPFLPQIVTVMRNCNLSPAALMDPS